MTRRQERSDFVLLVEADPIVGLDLADALETAGYRVTGPMRTAAEARTWLSHGNPDLAVLDGTLTVLDGVLETAGARLADTLRRRGIPFLVCAEPDGEADAIAAFDNVPWLSKPAWHRDVIRTMGELAARGGRAE